MKDGSKIEFLNSGKRFFRLPDPFLFCTYFDGICRYSWDFDACLSNIESGFGSCHEIHALVTKDNFSSDSIQALLEEKHEITIYVPPSQDGFRMNLTIHGCD